MDDKSSIINSSLEYHPVVESAIPTVLVDDVMKKIYMLTQWQPMKASDLMKAGNIAQTSIYRKLSWMLDNGIIKGKIAFNGYKYEVTFHPVIDKIRMTFKNGKSSIRVWLIEEQSVYPQPQLTTIIV